MIRPRLFPAAPVRRVLSAARRELGLRTLAALTAPGRGADQVRIRRVVAGALRLTEHSYEAIGDILGIHRTAAYRSVKAAEEDASISQLCFRIYNLAVYPGR